MGTQTTNTAPQSTTNAQGNGGLPLPQSDRDVEHLQGHWLLARIGKRVLRPGGKKLTGRMLAKTELEGKDVVEFAPGLGRTTQLILERKPKSYRGVDRGPQVVITNLGLMRFDEETKRMYVAEYFPGVTPQDIQDNTGFEIDTSRATQSVPPEPECLEILRNQIDPSRLYIGKE